MKNLFIIRSPLQLLNAVEAIFHFSLFDDNNILYIIDTKGLSNNEQINNILKNYAWTEIVKIESTRKSNFLNYIDMLKKLKKDDYKYLFLGDYGNIHKIIMANIQVENIFLLDDGTASIVIQEKLLNNEFNMKDIFKLLRYLPFGLSIKKTKKINFFTIFALKKTDNIGIIQNEMKNLKFNYDIEHFKNSQHIHILGQPFIESKILSQETYIKYFISSVKKYYYNNEMIEYFPHRAENIDNAVTNLKNKFENFSIIQNSIPLEKYFLENKIYPSIIIGFTSTALFTLKILFPRAEIFYIEVPQEDIFPDKKESMSSIYKILKNSDILKLN